MNWSAYLLYGAALVARARANGFAGANTINLFRATPQLLSPQLLAFKYLIINFLISWLIFDSVLHPLSRKEPRRVI